jgi:hypothetical protein
MLRVHPASRLSWSVQFRASFFLFLPPISKDNNMGDSITLLDRFALAALPAIIASYDLAAIQDKVSLGALYTDQIAHDAYQMARAMMAERERPSIPLPVRGEDGIATIPLPVRTEAGVPSGRPPRPA